MSDYLSSKKQIDQIRDDYKEWAFRAGIFHLLDVGVRHLTKELVDETCAKIMQEDDTNKYMTNDFQCDILRVAYELAQIPHTDLLVYIQREVDYDVCDGVMTYSKATRILKNCLSWISEDSVDTLEAFECIGLDDEEIEFLGYGYLLDLRENE